MNFLQLPNYYFTRVSNLLKSLTIVNDGTFYELWERQHLQKLFKHYEVDCVFDVGANYGQYARMLRRKVGYRGLIISFEPIPEAASALRQQAQNDPKWIVEEMALSSMDGVQHFNIMESTEFSSLSTPSEKDTTLFQRLNKVAKTVSVRTEKLETAYQRMYEQHQFKRPFLKLDTQGYDLEIVQNSHNVLGQFVGLQSELAVKKLYAHSKDFVEAIRTYETHGFELSAFVPNNEGHFPRLIETDGIFVRKASD